jgi:hypothetical protein
MGFVMLKALIGCEVFDDVEEEDFGVLIDKFVEDCGVDTGPSKSSNKLLFIPEETFALGCCTFEIG